MTRTLCMLVKLYSLKVQSPKFVASHSLLVKFLNYIFVAIFLPFNMFIQSISGHNPRCMLGILHCGSQGCCKCAVSHVCISQRGIGPKQALLHLGGGQGWREAVEQGGGRCSNGWSCPGRGWSLAAAIRPHQNPHT